MAKIVPLESYLKSYTSIGANPSFYAVKVPSNPHPEYVIRTSYTWKIYWDLGLIVLVIYNSLSVPFLAAFDPENKLEALEVLEYILDCLFAIDILFSFVTSYMDENGDEVLDRRQIAKHYGCSYKFPLDVFGVIPVETILVSVR
jgi:hypothetical protein